MPGTVPNLSIEERRALALEVLEYCNLFPKLWEGRHSWMVGQLLHWITDPRETKPFEVNRGTRVGAALKKNPALWARVKGFMSRKWYNDECKCRHDKDNHRNKKYECTQRKRRYDQTSPTCGCTKYEERGL